MTSVLCAQAQDLHQLIGARALQGLGGGTITAAVFATVPTLFSPADRARIVGLFTGTYGLASIIGPLVGGIVTDTVGLAPLLMALSASQCIRRLGWKWSRRRTNHGASGLSF